MIEYSSLCLDVYFNNVEDFYDKELSKDLRLIEKMLNDYQYCAHNKIKTEIIDKFSNSNRVVHINNKISLDIFEFYVLGLDNKFKNFTIHKYNG